MYLPGATAKFQGSYNILSLNTVYVVTRKHKIREIPMPTWVIQCVEALAVRDGRDISDGNEPLLVDHFSNENDFAADLHGGGIIGVAQDDYEKDGDKDNSDDKIDEYLDDTPGISLEPAAKFQKCPHQNTQWNGLTRKQGRFRSCTSLFPSDYDSDDESDDEYEDTDTTTQKRQRVIQPEAMPPTARNVYNIRLWNENNYAKEDINQLMLFTQVGNEINEDACRSCSTKEWKIPRRQLTMH